MSNLPVIAFLNKMTDLILLNVIYIIFCLPIVTIGAATTAMYYVCIVSIRQGDGYVWKRFLKSFRDNFKQATIIWLPMLVIIVLLGFDLFFWYALGTVFAKIMFVISAIVAFAIGIVCLYVFPVLAKLEGGIKATIKNAAAFAIGYFPYTIVLILFTVGFCYANYVSLGMNAITVFIGFALLAYMKSFFIYKVMMNHIDERYDDFLDELSDQFRGCAGGIDYERIKIQ